MGEPSLYAVLDVAKSATPQDIKRAYYALAHRFHPDKTPNDPHATERFRQATLAYAVLNDKRRRALYDRFGRFGLKLMPDAPRGQAELTPQTALRSVVNALAQEVRSRLDGLENKLKDWSRGEDEHLTVNVSPVLLLCGGQVELRVRRATRCAPCEGSGAQTPDDKMSCRFCQGRGEWDLSWGGLSQSQPCAFCQGRGFRVERRCQACRGKGMQYPFTQLKVRIPTKTSASRVLRVPEQGGLARQAQGRRGDLLIHLRAISDAVFTVEDHDLLLEWPLTPKEAALGGTVEIPMPDGAVHATVPAGCQAGDLVGVENAGLYDERLYRGHLRLKIRIEIPVTLSETQQLQWQQLGDEMDPFPLRRDAMLRLRHLAPDTASP